MNKLRNLIGMKFGKLTVIGRAESRNGKTYWKCKCDCGNEKIVYSLSLLYGKSQSCGCGHRKSHLIHGMSHSSIYQVWSNMKRRCFDPNNKRYNTHGARGITVCDEWLIFENFYSDVSKLEHFGESGYSLDRINNNGNYELNNVRWADVKTQSRNRRNNHIVEFEGQKMAVAEFAEKNGVKAQTLYNKIYLGYTDEEIVKITE